MNPWKELGLHVSLSSPCVPIGRLLSSFMVLFNFVNSSIALRTLLELLLTLLWSIVDFYEAQPELLYKPVSSDECHKVYLLFPNSLEL